jgi:hypothetical protein
MTTAHIEAFAKHALRRRPEIGELHRNPVVGGGVKATLESDRSSGRQGQFWPPYPAAVERFDQGLGRAPCRRMVIAQGGRDSEIASHGDDENARARLRHEQLRIDHGRADGVARIGERLDHRDDVLALAAVDHATNILDQGELWRSALALELAYKLDIAPNKATALSVNSPALARFGRSTQGGDAQTRL